MDLDFNPVQLDRQSDYLDFLTASGFSASDYSFVNLWGWAEAHGLKWAWDKDNALVWLMQTVPQKAFWAPVGQWETVDWGKCLKNLDTDDLIFNRVPEALALLWKETFGSAIQCTEARDQWDYIYDIDDLKGLRGNRFHKKKNLVNQFIKAYDFTICEFNSDVIQEVLEMQSTWCEWRDCESSEALTAENFAIQRVLEGWAELFQIRGAALYVDGGIAAYTVGEIYAGDTLLIHFEKGDPGYKGSYQAINQMFAQQAPADLKWINREQDLGSEGLRKAKMSYHPSRFIKKYRVEISL